MSRGFLVAVFVLVVGGYAHADAKQQAADLAAKAAQYYKHGEFEESAKLLREAYARYPEPNLLYNLARSLEGLGDRQGAIDAYEQYLASAKKIEDRPGIERRLDTLKAELADEKKRGEAKPPEPPPPEPEKQQPPPDEEQETEKAPPEPEHKRSKLAPWITLASGVAIAAAGGAFGLLANSSHNQAASAMTGVDAQNLQDTAKRDALVANVLFGVGGAVVIAGIVWVW